MSLEDLEKNLYREHPPRHEDVKHPMSQETPHKGFAPPSSSLGNTLPPAHTMTAEEALDAADRAVTTVSRFGRWAFWCLIGVTALIAGAGAFYLYQYFTSRNVALDIQAPTDVLTGAPFEISARFTNQSDKVIHGGRIDLFLPDNTFLTADGAAQKRVFTKGVGDVATGGSVEAKIPLVAYQGNDTVRTFRIVASYLLSSLGPETRLEAEKSVAVNFRSPAITLDLTAPQKVLPGEPFDIRIDYRNASGIEFNRLAIALDIPPFITVSNTNPSSTAGATWQLDRLAPASGGSIAIKGVAMASDLSFFDVHATIKSDANVVSDKRATVNIAPAPLALRASVNGQSNYVSHAGDTLHYAIAYSNNSDVAMSDVVVTAKLSGAMFDFTTLRTQGSYDSVANTITWNTANTPELRLVQPKSQGAVTVDLQTKLNYPIKRLSDKNFILKIDAGVSSPTVPYYVATDKTVAVAHLENKIQGAVALQSFALFKDSTLGAQNQGPFPLKANSPTTFTIHWLITNYSTDLRNVQVRSTLPSGVRATGKAQSTVTSAPAFNDRTGEIVWSIDRIPATKGIVGKPAEAIFQIEATPNITQIGQPMPLVGDVSITAIDDFASSTLSASAPAITSELTHDPSFTQGQGTVRQ